MTVKTSRHMDASIEVFDEDLFDGWTGARVAGAFDIVTSYVTGQVLLALDRTGALDELRRGPASEGALLARAETGMGQALLTYGIQLGLLRSSSDGEYALTPRGRLISTDIAVARLGVYAEAYGPVLSELPRLATGELTYGRDVQRDGAALGRHCATLFSAFHSRVVLDMLPEDSRHLVDLGCGGGSLVVDACASRHGLRGTGIDESPGAVQEAEILASSSDAGPRARFARADVFDVRSWSRTVDDADFLCAFSVVHELFRDGSEAVVEWLTDLRRELPNVGRFLIGEPELGRHGVDNDHEFELIHRLTGQGLPASEGEWIQVLAASPWKLESIRRRSVGPGLVYYELSA